MTAVLSVDDLSIWADGRALVEHVSFEVACGQIVALAGASGVGKTQVALSLMGLNDERLSIAGKTVFCGQPLPLGRPNDKAWQAVRGTKIAHIFQDPKHVFDPTDTIKRAFIKILKHHHKKVSLTTLTAVLDQVGLTNPKRFLSAYPHELSGGEAQRIAIALAYLLDPVLIIADEPTSALDDDHKRAILTLFGRFVAGSTPDKPRALIIISHDDEVKQLADKVVAIKNMAQMDLGEPSVHVPSEPILTIRGLSLGYRGAWFGRWVAVLKDFNLCIEQGQMVGLMGASGTGKTSLALAITRLSNRLVIKGEMTLFADDTTWQIPKLKGKKLRQYRPKVMLMSQEVSDSLNPDLTIHDSLKEAQTPHSPPIDDLLLALGLDRRLLGCYPKALSGGQQARICLVRILLTRPKLIILDEPTAMLDGQHTAKMLQLLRHINQKFGVAMLIISHDKAVLLALCHQVVAIF